jgi:hypothetical protein
MENKSPRIETGSDAAPPPDLSMATGELRNRIHERVDHYTKWSKFWTTIYNLFLYCFPLPDISLRKCSTV